jgi:molybdenum-dependent DNA-binding transcriptional regulator ModE
MRFGQPGAVLIFSVELRPSAWSRFMKLVAAYREPLAACLALCRTSSFSAAARELGLSQPTVRRQIVALEALIGRPSSPVLPPA